MLKQLRIFLLFLLANASLELFSQTLIHKKNQYDSNLKKHGYWVEVTKLNPDKKTFKGWYNHGSETKRCIYYNDGVKCLKFRYVNDSLLRIKRYGMDGNLEYKGTALWLTTNNEMRFCWDGDFIFYDSNRHKVKKVSYIRGIEQDLD